MSNDDDDLIDALENRTEHALQFLRYADYGPDRWPVHGVMNAGSLAHAFVDVRNPLDHRAVIVDINLGVAPQLHVALERMRPRAEQLSEETIRARLMKMSPLRAEYVRVRCEWAALAVLRIPREWVAGLRRIRNGYAVSGLAPFLEVVGEENPPVHPALYEPEAVPPAPRRRSASKS